LTKFSNKIKFLSCYLDVRVMRVSHFSVTWCHFPA